MAIDSQSEKEISQTRAESEKPSAFSVSEEEIDRILRSGSGFENEKLRIAVLYEQESDTKERADYLKQEYGTGGKSWIFEDDEHGFVDHSGKGLFIRKYGFDQEQRLTWTEVEKRVSRLVEADDYLSENEKGQLAEGVCDRDRVSRD